MTVESHRETRAAELMLEFADRTGLTAPDRTPQRYLWTDAFAVCNFVGLARARDSARYLALASRLVEQVHRTLGRHRPDDPRRGWISGLSEGEGATHPTRGGLRIGKPLPERRVSEPLDPELEWDRDGQYFHYLTKWMHALDQLTRSTGEPAGNRWARELAETAHAAFVHRPAAGAPTRMVWKASIDLTRALVPSMGQHDPIDGLVTYAQLEAHRSEDGPPDLSAAIGEMARLVGTTGLATDDPLGIGGLLFDAHRVEQLVRSGSELAPLLPALLAAAATGLAAWLRTRPLDRPAHQRLAFRELGLTIGLHAADRMRIAFDRDATPIAGEPQVRPLLEHLAAHAPVCAAIESIWLDPAQQHTRGWLAHRDINDVMLATTLLPDGFLDIGP